MADSVSTKKALANSLKELMKTTSFAKITIADICDQCNMSRKSFYYHFKDKYDLVNWIFESEYIEKIHERVSLDNIVLDTRWEMAEDLCSYFYNNKDFYSKVFRIKGQNCFTEYFRELITPLLEARIQMHCNDRKIIDFCVAFYADAALSAIERWIGEKDTMPPNELIFLLKNCVSLLPAIDIL